MTDAENGFNIKKIKAHNGWGSVGRAVASDCRGPWFESSHRQKNILNIYFQMKRLK